MHIEVAFEINFKINANPYLKSTESFVCLMINKNITFYLVIFLITLIILILSGTTMKKEATINLIKILPRQMH